MPHWQDDEDYRDDVPQLTSGWAWVIITLVYGALLVIVLGAVNATGGVRWP